MIVMIQRLVKPIEVKGAPRIKSDMLSGLRAFKADYQIAKCILVYGGEQRENHDGVEIIGAIDFLKTLPTHIGL